jgi:geranylgeranyl transferase type-2 subunit beta
MTLDFLAVHDALLGQGAVDLGDGFRALQVGKILSFAMDGGGFRGRGGPADPYYADFACRSLKLLAPEHTAIQEAASWVSELSPAPKDAIDAFSRTNVLRMAGRALPDIDARKILSSQALGNGLFSRLGERQPSAYNTFLANLTLAALGDPIEVSGLEQLLIDGGFGDMPGETVPQTSATAAAVSVLLMSGTLKPDTSDGVCEFLCSMQASDGGFLAHPAAPHSDLLSSYVAYLSLVMLGGEEAADVQGLGRFLRGVALPDGGFLSCGLDTETDVEYTFYGLGLLCLLRLKSEEA